MSGDMSVCLFEESGSVVHFTPERRTIISSVQLMLSESTADVKGSHEFALWGHVVPAESVMSADSAYLDTRPVVLALLAVDVPDKRTRCVSLSAPISRLELTQGSRLSLTLAHAATPTNLVEQRLTTGALRGRKRARGGVAKSCAGNSTLVSSSADETDAPLLQFMCVTIRLGGLFVGPPLPLALSMLDWRPFVVRRWLLCVVEKSTVVQPPPEKTDELGMCRPTDQPREWWRPVQGSVMEAVALSVDGKLVRWRSGAVGLAKEFVPYSRFYTSARAEKTVRVRRHPHRYADVVGEVPFGQVVEALGEMIDAFYEERYVLLYLPTTMERSESDRLIADYNLANAGDGRCVWGWSKVSGRSGLPLLQQVVAEDTTASAVEVDTPADNSHHHKRPPRLTRGFCEQVRTPLPSGSLFACANGKKRASTRECPSTSEPVVSCLEPNEVREAIAVVEIFVPRDDGHMQSDNVEFVQWANGEFELLRSGDDIFLAPVEVESFSPAVQVREMVLQQKSSPIAGFTLPTASVPTRLSSDHELQDDEVREE